MNKLITERDITDARRKRQIKIAVTENGIVTPAALDAARRHNIEIVRGNPPQAAFQLTNASSLKDKPAKIIIGSDHGGFELKQTVTAYLEEHGFEFEDVGTFSTDSVDYPDFAFLVAQKVSGDLTMVGIIIDGAGVGSAMTANKVPGIRAAACYDIYTAKNSREHNFANVLTLGSRVTGVDIVLQIISAWLATGFGGERHKRRVEKITQIEKKYLHS